MFITEHIRYSVLKERQELIWIVEKKNSQSHIYSF